MIRQFKFTNGEEIICEVISSEPEEDEIIARFCFKILKLEAASDITYYSFRPWMMLKDELQEPVSINAYHIVAMANPSSEMLKEYKQALIRFKSEDEAAGGTMNIDEAIDKLATMNIDDIEDLDESNEDNIIDFPFDKDKLH